MNIHSKHFKHCSLCVYSLTSALVNASSWFVLLACTCSGISLPEGVDPSFLAALPEDIRREVLQNQLGIRPPSRSTTTTLPSAATPVLGGGAGVTEVSPEFLAALPPAIQEEVRHFCWTRISKTKHIKTFIVAFYVFYVAFRISYYLLKHLGIN